MIVLGCKLPSVLTGGGAGGSGKGTATGGSDPKADIVEASKKFIDFVAPDRFHIKYLGGTGAGMEIIYIGTDSYMKTGDKWSKMPSSGVNIPNLRDSFTEAGLKTLTDVKFEGEDTVDGKPAMAYSYKNVTPVGAYPFTSKIWISQQSGLPLKIYVEYSNGMLKNMTVNYDTESPVSIEAPIK